MKADHTWPLYLHYHKCPECGTIIESRKDFQYVLGAYKKELHCFKCKNNFSLFEKNSPTFGPLLGNPQLAEFEWP